MFKLSSYVADPLTLRGSVWQHPVTGQSVGLSDELRMMLPDIAQQNLDQEGEGPEQVLQQLLAAELAARGFLIPLAWQTREDEYLRDIAPFRPAEKTLFSLASCERQLLPAYARLAVFSASTRDPDAERQSAADQVRQLCQLPAVGSTLYSLSSGKILPLDQAFDLGRKVAGGLSTASLLQQTSQMIAQLPAACVPLILADGAVWTQSLLKGLAQREGAPRHLLLLDELLRFRPDETPQGQTLPPLCSENLLNHLRRDFPETRLHSLGLSSYQSLPEGASGLEWLTALKRLGPRTTLEAAAQLSPHEWERLLPRGDEDEGTVALAINAQLLNPEHQGIWSTASILGFLRCLLLQSRVKGLVIWGLEGLLAGPPSSTRHLLLTLLEGVLR